MHNHLNYAISCKYIYKIDKPFLLLNRKNTIIFEGSNNLKQLSYSLKINKNTEKIHSGYSEYANLCKDELDKLNIVNKLDKSEKIKFGAHSLGAVTATLLAYDIVKDDPDVNIDLILFGSPRPGGKEFVDDFNSCKNINVYNYINKCDPIQFFPWVDDYLHVGKPIYLSQCSSAHILKNHSIEMYIDNVFHHQSKNLLLH